MTADATRELIRRAFARLSEESIRYVVLRGHERLPNDLVNDIDLGVRPQDKHDFENTIRSVSDADSWVISHKVAKHGFDRFILARFGDLVQLDVWTRIQYRGLAYVDFEAMLNRSFVNANGVRILRPEDELSISFLKELLHMGQLRPEKSDYLVGLVNHDFDVPFTTYWAQDAIAEFQEIILDKRLKVPRVRQKAIKSLWRANTRRHGVRQTIKQCALFATMFLKDKIH